MDDSMHAYLWKSGKFVENYQKFYANVELKKNCTTNFMMFLCPYVNCLSALSMVLLPFIPMQEKGAISLQTLTFAAISLLDYFVWCEQDRESEAIPCQMPYDLENDRTFLPITLSDMIHLH